MRDYLWVSLNEYARLSAEDRKRWNVAVDLTRGCDERYQQVLMDEYVKDRAEYEDEMSIGGQPYREPGRG